MEHVRATAGRDLRTSEGFRMRMDREGHNGPAGVVRAKARQRYQAGATYCIWGLARIAEAVGVSESTIRDYIVRKGLPVLVLGGAYVTTRGLIDLWILTKIRERG